MFEMLSWRPSGLMLTGLAHSDSSRAMLWAAGTLGGGIMDLDGEPIDSVVGISHRRAGAGGRVALTPRIDPGGTLRPTRARPGGQGRGDPV